MYFKEDNKSENLKNEESKALEDKNTKVTIPKPESNKNVEGKKDIEKAILTKKDEFNQKKELCLSASKKMNLRNLCEKEILSKEDIELLSDEEFKVCKHVVEENVRVKKAVQFLKDDNPNEFGKLMTESHLSLSKYYGVSTDELNKLVSLSNSFGALGSKLTGAGFGGAVVTLVKNDKVEELKKMILEKNLIFN